MLNTLSRSGAILGIVLTLCLTSPAVAEVAVFLGDGGFPIGHIMQSVIDESEPVGIAWTPYHLGDPNYAILNPQGLANDDGPPSAILRSTPGFPVVAWSQNTPAGYDIVVSRFDGVAWTTPQVVADSSADELDPHLVVDPDGKFHLVYWVNDASPRVLHREAPADLSAWSAAVQVSEIGEMAVRPWGAIHDGTLHVAYEVHGQALGSIPRQIMHAVADGSQFSSELVSSTQHGESNWVRVHSASGQLWLDWIDSNGEMAWSRWSAPGSWDPVALEPFETIEQREIFVRGQIRRLVLGY